MLSEWDQGDAIFLRPDPSSNSRSPPTPTSDQAPPDVDSDPPETREEGGGADPGRWGASHPQESRSPHPHPFRVHPTAAGPPGRGLTPAARTSGATAHPQAAPAQARQASTPAGRSRVRRRSGWDRRRVSPPPGPRLRRTASSHSHFGGGGGGGGRKQAEGRPTPGSWAGWPCRGDDVNGRSVQDQSRRGWAGRVAGGRGEVDPDASQVGGAGRGALRKVLWALLVLLSVPVNPLILCLGRCKEALSVNEVVGVLGLGPWAISLLVTIHDPSPCPKKQFY